MKGYVYVLKCFNDLYYTGSTNNLEKRLIEHKNGKGANFTKKHLPVKLIYFQEFDRIDDAFQREKQIQGWSRKKKEALIFGKTNLLHNLSECRNNSHFKNKDIISAPLNDRGENDD
ncbi:MAG: GIY-YIG nuclease family protein [Aequorivita sp.]